MKDSKAEKMTEPYHSSRMKVRSLWPLPQINFQFFFQFLVSFSMPIPDRSTFPTPHRLSCTGCRCVGQYHGECPSPWWEPWHCFVFCVDDSMMRIQFFPLHDLRRLWRLPSWLRARVTFWKISGVDKASSIGTSSWWWWGGVGCFGGGGRCFMLFLGCCL